VFAASLCDRGIDAVDELTRLGLLLSK